LSHCSPQQAKVGSVVHYCEHGSYIQIAWTTVDFMINLAITMLLIRILPYEISLMLESEISTHKALKYIIWLFIIINRP
jgi:hypothetical protein